MRIYEKDTATPYASARRNDPGNAGKGGISHVASAFDHARRADTRPAAGFLSQIAVDPVSGDADTGSK